MKSAVILVAYGVCVLRHASGVLLELEQATVLSPLKQRRDENVTLTTVTLGSWESCRDCKEYESNLVEFGLKKGLGKLIKIDFCLNAGAHTKSGNATPDMHAWVACGGNVTGSSDPDYSWLQVGGCALDGKKTVTECALSVGISAELHKPILACMADEAKATSLVDEMHRNCQGHDDFPWVEVEGTALPAPDESGNDLTPLLKAICDKAGATAAAGVVACSPETATAAGVAATAASGARATAMAAQVAAGSGSGSGVDEASILGCTHC